MESIQGERRDDNATPDAYVPAVLSDAGTESQTVEARCKRRRLGSEFEVQRHLDRGPQVGISLVGQPGHDAQVQSDAAADLRRDSIPSGTTCSSWTTARSDPQVLGPAAGQAGHTSLGCHDGHPMAFGPQSAVLGSLGDVPTTSEILRQWHHTADLASNQDGQSSAIIPRQCHLPTIEEIVTGILEIKLGGSGSTCYINSVLQAQTWSCAMNLTFNTAIWGAWEKHILSMFVEHAGVVVDPCAKQFLGHLFVD